MRKQTSNPPFVSAELPVAATLSKILEARRDFVSSQLVEVCREHTRPRILSVANGALREAERAVALCRQGGGSFVALDGTGEPPDLFRLDSPNPCVRYITYPYGAIPSRDNIGEFDFVYSLNLMNELDGRRAKQVVRDMLAVVRPGGRLLLSNFTSELAHVALAGFHRREEELADLLPDSVEHPLLGHAIWRDDSRALLYLEVQKAGSVSCGRAPRLGFLHQENQWRQ